MAGTFGEEVNGSRPARTPIAQLITDLRKLGKHTAPHVANAEELRDHLQAFGEELGKLHERAVDLIEPPPPEEKPKPTSKRKAAKTKDRQETSGTNRGEGGEGGS